MLIKDKNRARGFIFGFLILLLGSFVSAAESYVKDWVYGNLLTAEITKEMNAKKSDMGGFSYNEKEQAVYGIKSVPNGKKFKNYVAISELGEKPGEYNFFINKETVSGFEGKVGPADFDKNGNMWIADKDGKIYKLELDKSAGKAISMDYTVDKQVNSWAYANYENLKEERLYFLQGDTVKYFTVTDGTIKGPFDYFKIDRKFKDIDYIFINKNVIYIYPKGDKALYKVALSPKVEVALLSAIEIGNRKLYELADLIRNEIGPELIGGESGGKSEDGNGKSSGTSGSNSSTSETLYDFGDAPDTSYTGFNYKTLNSSPARHKKPSDSTVSPHFGDRIDYEGVDSYETYYLGRGLAANLAADADDKYDTDDEDGIVEVNGVPFDGGVVTLIEASTNTIKVKVSNITSDGAYVKAWLDGLNGTINYQFDNTANGIIYDQKVNSDGFITYSFYVEQLGNRATTAGNTYMRMRIVTDRKPGIEGTEDDGEIEDYRVYISERKLDFGDLPTSYKTTLTDDGPRHLDIFLFGETTPKDGLQIIGNYKDYEIDGQSDPGTSTYNGLGDDKRFGPDQNGIITNGRNDEDGVTFFASSGTTAGSFLYSNDTNKIVVKTNGTGRLAVYVDLNRNGTFLTSGGTVESGELVSHTSVSGINTITEIPLNLGAISSTGNSSIGVRVRFAPDDYLGNSQVDLPTGLAYGGEVEDYYIEVRQKPDVTVTKSIVAGGVSYDSTNKIATIPYSITVKNNNSLPYSRLNLEDVFTYTPLLSNVGTISYTQGTIPSGTFNNGSVTGITLGANETLTYTFDVKIPYSKFTALSTEVDNTVTLKDRDMVLGTSSAETNILLTELVELDKQVGKVDDSTAGKIKIPYTFTLTNSLGIDYSNLSLEDIFSYVPTGSIVGNLSFALTGTGNPAGILIDPTTGKITNISLPGNSTGSNVVTITILVTIDSKNVTYNGEITINNTATLKDGDTTLATDNATVKIPEKELLELDKTVGTVDYSTTGSIKIPYTFKITNGTGISYTDLKLTDTFIFSPLLKNGSTINFVLVEPASGLTINSTTGEISGILVPGNAGQTTPTVIPAVEIKIIVTIDSADVTAVTTQVNNKAELYDRTTKVGEDTATTTITPPEQLDLTKTVGTVDYSTVGKVKIPYTFKITNGTGLSYSGLKIKEDSFTFDPILSGGAPSFVFDGPYPGLTINSTTGEISGISVPGNSTGVEVKIIVTIDSSAITAAGTKVDNTAGLYDGTTKVGEDTATTTITPPERLDLTKTVGTVDYSTVGKVKIPYTFKITNGTGLSYSGLKIKEDSFNFAPTLGGIPSFSFAEIYSELTINSTTGEIGGISVPGNSTGVEIKILVTVNSSDITGKSTQVDNTAGLYDGITKVGEDTATTTITLPELLDLTKTVGVIDYSTTGKVKIPYTFKITNGSGIAYTGLKITEESFVFAPTLSGGAPSFAFDGTYPGLSINSTTGEITGISVPGNAGQTSPTAVAPIEIKILVAINYANITSAITQVDNTAVLYDGIAEVGRDKATTTINTPTQLSLEKEVGAIDYTTIGKVKIPYTFTITNGSGILHTGLKITEESFVFNPALSGGSPKFALDGTYPNEVQISEVTGEITGISVSENGSKVIKIIVTIDSTNITSVTTKVDNTAVLYDKNGKEAGRDTATATITLPELLDLAKTVGTVDYDTPGKVKIPYTFTITNGSAIPYTGLNITDAFTFTPVLGGSPSFAFDGTYDGLTIDSATGEIKGIKVSANAGQTSPTAIAPVVIKILVTIDVTDITSGTTKVDNTAYLYDNGVKVGEGKATTDIKISEELNLEKTVGTIDYSTVGKVKIPYTFKIINGTGISYTNLKLTDIFTFTPLLKSGAAVNFAFNGTYSGLTIDSVTGEITGISVPGNSTGVEIKILVTVNSADINAVTTQVYNTAKIYDGDTEVGQDKASTTITLPEQLELDKAVGTVDYSVADKVKIPYTFTITNGTGATYNNLSIKEILFNISPALSSGNPKFELVTPPSGVTIDPETGEIKGITVPANAGQTNPTVIEPVVIKMMVTIDRTVITGRITTVENTAGLYDGETKVGEDSASTTITPPEALSIEKTAGEVDYSTPGKIKIPYTFTLKNKIGITYDSLKITDSFEFTPAMTPSLTFTFGESYPAPLAIDELTGDITGFKVLGNGTTVIKIIVSFDSSALTVDSTIAENTAKLFDGETEVGKATAVVTIEKAKLTFTKKADQGSDNVATPGELIKYSIVVQNTGDAPAYNITVTDPLGEVKNSVGNSMLDLSKPIVVTLNGDILTGTVAGDGTVTVLIPEIPKAVGADSPGTAQVDIQVYVKNPYPSGTESGETILNAITVTDVTPPDCQIGSDDTTYDEYKCGPIVIPTADELLLRNDVFDNDKMSELTAGTLVANLPSATLKNSNPPVIEAGTDAFYFITLTNNNPVSVIVPTTVETVTTDYESLKDSGGFPAFTEFEFVGILYTDTNNPANTQFKQSSDKTELVAFLAGLNYGSATLTEDDFDMTKVPANSSLTFVVRARVNPNGTFNSGLENFASLEEDVPQTFSNFNERELRRTVIIPRSLVSEIIINKMTEKDNVSVGQFVPYTIEITNNNPFAVDNVYIEDRVPAGFIFVEGSVRAFFSTNGQTYSGGDGIPLSSSGNKIVKIGPFSIPAKADKVRVTYLMKVGVGVTTGVYKNIAVVKNDGGTPISNVSEADVRVVPDALFDQTVIIGKVFFDKNGNGAQDEELGEYGIPGVRVATIDGINAITDAYGRFHIPEVTDEHGKNFIIKVDPSTLPQGSEFTTENPLVRRLGKVMLRYNFGVKLPEPKVVKKGTALEVVVKHEMFKKNSNEFKNSKEVVNLVLKKLNSGTEKYSKIVLKPGSNEVNGEKLMLLSELLKEHSDTPVIFE